MKIYSKLLGKIQNNKARVKKVVGIVSVAVGLRYGKINPIPASLWSNSTQQVEQVQNYVEEDIQVIDTDGKVIKTGSVILIGNQEVYLVEEREFNSFEDNDQKVILVKTGDSAPSVPTSPGRGQPSQFPTPPSGGRPSRPVYVPKYRTAPKVVDQGLGAGANPAGAGGGGGAAEFDDQCPAPKKKQSQESKTFDSDYRSNDPKKKRSAEQCELDENVKDAKIEIVYKIKENPALVREAERMGKDQAAQKDVNNLIEQLSLGNENPGIGNRRVKGLKSVSEARGRNEGRVYFREKDGKIEILAKSNKDNQNKVIGILQKMGY
jgi:hypothetical protein